MINNFKRVEKKFYLDANKVDSVVGDIMPYVKPDQYSKTQINSIYLDDKAHNIINRSIEKPTYKEKLRIRIYGKLSDNNQVYVELKKKFKGVVYKRRICMSKNAAILFLSRTPYLEAIGAFPLNDNAKQTKSYSVSSQIIANEIHAFMERHNWPKPSFLIRCDRLSFKTIISNPIKIAEPKMPEQAVRITFDNKLEYCDLQNFGPVHQKSKDVTLSFNNIIPSSDSIMEAKFMWGIPIWLTNILTKNNIYTQGFSKVGNAYINEVKR